MPNKLNFREIFISKRGLIRMEMVFVVIFEQFFALLFASIEDVDFSYQTINIFCVVYASIFLLTFFVKWLENNLRNIANGMYLSAILYVIYVAHNNEFNRGSFYAVLLVYTFLCFTFSRLKTYWRLNLVVFSCIFLCLYYLDFETKSSLILISSSFIVIATAGYALTTARVYFRKRIKDKQELVDQIFNQSNSGLILINPKDGKIFEANENIAKLFEYKDPLRLKGLSIYDLNVFGQKLFNDKEDVTSKTMELEDDRILTISKSEITHQNEPLILLHFHEYKSLNDLSLSVEFEKLKSATEENYESLFEKSAVAICIVNKAGKIIDSNESLCNMLEYPKWEIIGKSYSHFDFRNYDEERQKINRQAWNGAVKTFKKEIKTKSEKVITVEIVLQKGKYLGEDVLISNSKDITENIELERESNFNYYQYSMLFEESPISIVISDLVGKILKTNTSFERFVGYSKEELINTNVNELSYPEDMEKNLLLRKKLLNGEIPYIEMRKRYIHKNGEIKNSLLKIVLQRDEEDQPFNFLAQIVDITDIIEAESKLIESEKSYRDIFNNSHELLYVLNNENRFIDVNQTVLDKYGYGKEEILNQLPEIFSAGDKNDMESVFKKTESAWKGEDQDLLWWSKTKSGKIFPKDLNLRKGKYFGSDVLVASGRDISAQFNYEQKLEKSRKKYKELIDSSIIGIAILRQDNIVFANQKLIEITSYHKIEDLVGQSRERLFDFSEYPSVFARLNLLKKGDEEEMGEILIKNAFGEKIEVGIKPKRIDFDGEESIMLSILDLSDKKRAEQAQKKVLETTSINESLRIQLEENRKIQRELKDNQSFTEGIIESSQELILTADVNGLITKINSAGKKQLQIEDEDIIGEHLKVIFKDEKVGKLIYEKTKSDKLISKEVVLRRKDDSLFSSYLSVSQLYSTANKLLGLVCVSKDISDIIEKEKKIRIQANKLNSIIESSSHFFFTVNKEHSISSFNELFKEDIQKHLGLNIKVGDLFYKLFDGREKELKEEKIQFWQRNFDRVFTGESIKVDIDRKDQNDNRFFREIFLNPITSETGDIIEVSGIAHDVTEKKLYEGQLKRSVEEKEVLLKEVHHRVKNNMQVISSILNLQSIYVKDTNVLDVLRESQSRINAMASIHERLYSTKSFSEIKFSEYAKNLAKDLVGTYNLQNVIKLDCEFDEVYLNLNLAIPCGLIINELISNSLKYAFEGANDASIEIKVTEKDKLVSLGIKDNGKGIPKEIDFRNTSSLGLQLVNTLVSQIEGEIKLLEERGTHFVISFENK